MKVWELKEALKLVSDETEVLIATKDSGGFLVPCAFYINPHSWSLFEAEVLNPSYEKAAKLYDENQNSPTIFALHNIEDSE